MALSNNRLLAIGDGQIQLRYKDYRDDSWQRTLTLSADEFIRRFLLHVLPEGFHLICYYGFLGNRHRQQKLAQSRRLLGMEPREETAPTDKAEQDYRDRYEALTGSSLWECPYFTEGARS